MFVTKLSNGADSHDQPLTKNTPSHNEGVKCFLMGGYY